MTKEEKELTITYLTKMQEEYIEGEGYERHPLPKYYALDVAIKALEQSTSDDCMGWIPVSERLPKPQENGDSDFTDWVQVSIRIDAHQSMVCSAYYCFSEKKWYMERMGCGEIVAWQPLPKPYEEKRGDSDGSN